MKIISLLLLALLTTFTYSQEISMVPAPADVIRSPQDNGVTEVLEVLGGILVGAFKSTYTVEECYNDSVEIFSDFRNAYIGLKEQTFDGVETGLVHIGRALLKMPDAMKDCKDLGAIITQIRKMAVTFSNPTVLTVTVGKNIIWHSVSIYREVKTAIGAYQHDEWFSFGVSIGSIMEMVILKNPKFVQNVNSDGTEFLMGFAHGVDPAAYTDLSQCIHTVSKDNVEKIKNYIKGLSWKHLKRSVENIEKIAKIFLSTVKSCKSGSKEVEKLIGKLTHVFNAGTFVKAALKIISNPLKFAKMVEHIHKDMKKHKYFAAGDETGKFVGKVLGLRAFHVEELLKETM